MADEYIKCEDVMKTLFAPEMCYTPVQVQIVKELPSLRRENGWRRRG